MEWQLSTERSVYMQLMDIIKRRILAGEYKPGDKLASVRDMALDAGVNPNTMQRALTGLEQEGLLYSQRTSGRYITEDEELIEAARQSLAQDYTRTFLQQMRQLGISREQVVNLIGNSSAD